MTDNDTTPATGTVGRTTSIGATALAAAVGGVAVGIVLGLRIAKDSVDTDGDDWWIVAWLVIGVIDARHRRRAGDAVRPPPSGWLPDRGRHGGADRRRGDRRRSWRRSPTPTAAGRMCRARSTGRNPIATGVLAALLPWELARTDRRRAIEIVWWITAGLIAVVAIGTAALDPGIHVLDVATWLVGISATAATLRLVICWWRRRGDPDPLPMWVAAGAVAAWLAVVPEQFEFRARRRRSATRPARCCCSPPCRCWWSVRSSMRCASGPGASTAWPTR